MTTKLYHHKTDGGAEYLCTSLIEGTDEGDLYTAIVRLDGEPELVRSIAPPELLTELLEVLRDALEVMGEWDKDDDGEPEWATRAREVIAKAKRD